MARKSKPARTAPDFRPGKGGSAQFKSILTAEEVAEHLEALSRALRTDAILVHANDQALEAAVGQRLQFSLDVRPGVPGKKSSIRVRMSWDEPKAEPELTITSG